MTRNAVIIALMCCAGLAMSCYFKPPFDCNDVKNYVSFFLTATVHIH